MRISSIVTALKMVPYPSSIVNQVLTFVLMVSLQTFPDSLLLQYSPAHLLEVVQVECQPFITLLTQASQLSGGYSVVE